MAITQSRSRVKPTGGKYRKLRQKKKRDIGRDFIPVKIGPTKVKKNRTLGGNRKLIVLQTDMVNVINPVSKEAKKVKIIQRLLKNYFDHTIF